MTPRRLLPLLLATLSGFSAPAAQAEGSPWSLGLSQAVSRSSNLLRLPADAAVPAGFSRADTVSSTALLAGLDQPFGRQRAYGSLRLSADRLSNNGIYDNEGYALSGGLDWATVERVSGTLRASANRTLADFYADEIGFLAKKNLQTTGEIDNTVRIGVVTDWTAELNGAIRSVDYSAGEYQSREFRERSAGASLRFSPGGAASLGLGWRETRGRYPRFRTAADGTPLPDHFARSDLDLSGSLQPSGASRLAARLSLARIRYDIASQRDFSGVTGLLRWTWQPTAKLRLDTRLTRDPSQSSYFSDGADAAADATVDYSRMTTTLLWRADWQATAKLAFNARLTHARRALTRTLSGSGSAVDGRDRRTVLEAGADWAPTRSLRLGCNVARDQRSGDTSTLTSDYRDNTLACSARFTLQ